MARLYPVGEEAAGDAGDGEQEEERGSQEAELLGCEVEFRHDRLGGQADHDLVGEVDQHEQEDEGGHAPGPLEGAVVLRHAAFLLAVPLAGP